jgi:hypothetical protein
MFWNQIKAFFAWKSHFATENLHEISTKNANAHQMLDDRLSQALGLFLTCRLQCKCKRKVWSHQHSLKQKDAKSDESIRRSSLEWNPWYSFNENILEECNPPLAELGCENKWNVVIECIVTWHAFVFRFQRQQSANSDWLFNLRLVLRFQ